MNPFKRILLFTVLLTSGGCAGRVPIPPGEVPAASVVTAEDEQYGQEVFNQLVAETPISHDNAKINRVRNIVDKLAVVIHAQDLPWHINVLEAPTVENAAATRGNFIFVWSGMIDAVQNDDELAAVLAHEISHVLAGHTQPTPSEEAAQASSGVGSGIAGQIASAYSGQPVVGQLAEALAREAMEAIFVDPESRRKELEADQIGLFVMADAGYDPHAAVNFWKRMSQTGEVDASIAILSSHPQSKERFHALEALMPQAEARYRLVKSGGLKRSTEWEASKNTSPTVKSLPVHKPFPSRKNDSVENSAVPKTSELLTNPTDDWSSRVEKNDAGEWVSKK